MVKSIKNKKCVFCEEIRKKLNKNIPFFKDGSVSSYKIYKKQFKVHNACGICRRFPLCEKHIKTIKKDNKLRIVKGMDIPTNLKLLRPLNRSDMYLTKEKL